MSFSQYVKEKQAKKPSFAEFVRQQRVQQTQQTPSAQVEESKPTSIYKDPNKFGRFDVKSFLTPSKDVAVGFGKGLAKVGQTILKPIDKLFGFKRGLGSEDLSPKGVFQNVGKIGADIAYTGKIFSSAAPLASSITKSATALKAPAAVQKLADVGGRSLLNAGLGYGTTKLVGYSDKDAKTTALITGSLPWASAAFSMVGKATGLSKVGQKIQYSLVKPTKTDLANGFKIENVNKYRLGGNLEQTAEKTQSAILERVGKLKSQLKKGSATVDLNRTYAETAKELEKLKFDNAASNVAIKRELDKLALELKLLAKDGRIDIADAQKIKQAFGAKGAWEYNVPREDANAIEAVYTKAYNILKTQIERSASSAGNTQVAQINRELSELIPIEQALIRRLPVAARQNPISLTDLVSAIGGTKLGGPLFILNRLSKSGAVGSKLAGVGSRPESRGALGTLISGPGEKQLKNAPKLGELKIPKVNVGLSIQNASELVTPKGLSLPTSSGKLIPKKTVNPNDILPQSKSLFGRILPPTKNSLTAEAAKLGTNRPIHQIEIEKAINSGNLKKAQQIINSLPDSDPYKKSMQSMMKMFLGR